MTKRRMAERRDMTGAGDAGHALRPLGVMSDYEVEKALIRRSDGMESASSIPLETHVVE